MGMVAQFGEINFEITQSSALLLKDLKISAEAETEDKDQNKQKYVSYKNGKAAEVNFSVDILAVFGQNVREVITKLLNTAQRGNSEYFYVGGEKIFPAKVIMTKAEASEIKIAPSGVWAQAKISVTMKQAESAYIIPDPVAENPAPVYYGGDDGGGGGWSASVASKPGVYIPDTAGYIAAAQSVVSDAKSKTSSVTGSGSKTVTVSGGSFGKVSSGLPKQ